jgi:hypothetical protein
MRRRVLLPAMVGVAAVGLGLVLWRHAPGRAREATPEASSDHQPDEIAALKREVASLKRMTVASAWHAQTAAAAAAKAPAATPPRPSAARLPPAEQKRVVKEAMEARYNSETVDPGWSAGRVTAIKGALATVLPDVKVTNVECATTICRAELVHDDPDSQSSLMEKTSENDALNTETFYLFDKESTPPRTVLYMAREGQRLPRPQL